MRHLIMVNAHIRAVAAPLSRGVDPDTATEPRDYSETAFMR